MITIKLSPAREGILKRAALYRGMSPEAYAKALLEDVLVPEKDYEKTRCLMEDDPTEYIYQMRKAEDDKIAEDARAVGFTFNEYIRLKNSEGFDAE